MTPRPIIEIVVHEATRSGSVRSLLRLLDAITPSQRDTADLRIRVLTAGPLLADLESHSTAPAGVDPTVVVLNSVVCLGEADRYPSAVTLIAYVHESEEALWALPAAHRETLVRRCAQVWCVSAAAADELESLGVGPDRIFRVPPIVDVASSPHPKPPTPGRPPLVIGCGVADWHKGPDLFLETAAYLARSAPELRFRWLGARSRHAARVLRHDTERLGLQNRMDWAGERPDISDDVAAADLILATSRREGMPVVPFEAAAVGTATVAFAVGGYGELADAGAVAAVPYPDVRSVAAEVQRLLADPGARADLVRHAVDHGRSQQSADHVASTVAHLLQSAMVAA